MSILELLKADHQKVAELFAKVEETESEKQHQQLFEKIKAELEMHMDIEETILYPLLKEHEELKDMTLEAYEEHKQVKTLIREISALVDGSERFDAKLKVMGENIDHHVKEEETELFPKVKKHISQQQLESLGDQMQQMKKDSGKSSQAGAGS
jgi:iron-sulfur cluster repair protein YtfE (RIC family)